MAQLELAEVSALVTCSLAWLVLELAMAMALAGN